MILRLVHEGVFGRALEELPPGWILIESPIDAAQAVGVGLQGFDELRALQFAISIDQNEEAAAR